MTDGIAALRAEDERLALELEVQRKRSALLDAQVAHKRLVVENARLDREIAADRARQDAASEHGLKQVRPEDVHGFTASDVTQVRVDRARDTRVNREMAFTSSATSNGGGAEEPVILEPHSKIRLKGKAMPAARLGDREFRAMQTLATTSAANPLRDAARAPQPEWFTVAVVRGAPEARRTYQSTDYLLVRITDLLGHTCNLFLLERAFRAWKKKLEPGMVLSLCSLKPLKRKEDDPPGFAADAKDAVHIVGRSADYDFCKATAENGDPCTEVINGAQGRYCELHSISTFRAAKAKRPELINDNSNLAFVSLGSRQAHGDLQSHERHSLVDGTYIIPGLGTIRTTAAAAFSGDPQSRKAFRKPSGTVKLDRNLRELVENQDTAGARYLRELRGLNNDAAAASAGSSSIGQDGEPENSLCVARSRSEVAKFLKIDEAVAERRNAEPQREPSSEREESLGAGVEFTFSDDADPEHSANDIDGGGDPAATLADFRSKRKRACI